MIRPRQHQHDGTIGTGQDAYVPRFRRAYENGTLEQKREKALNMLENCVACPRECNVNRMAGEKGVCMSDYRAPVGNYFPHFGEEDVLRGSNGSGTIFFSMCNLRCVFCQNYDISQIGEGMMKTPEEIAEMAIELQERGCHNINFVTPEHVVPQVVETIYYAAQKGLNVPIVYNTSAYDARWSLLILDGLVDIYMPDFKYFDPEASVKYLRGPDYPETARESIKYMHDQVGVLQKNDRGLAESGVIIRHLIMPGQVEDSRRILDWIAGNLPKETYVNIMDQYHPAARVEENPDKWKEIDRNITLDEFNEVVNYAENLGLENLDPRSNRFSVQ